MPRTSTSASPPAPPPGPRQRRPPPSPPSRTPSTTTPSPARPGSEGPARVFIEIAPGTYHERIIVTQNHPNITLARHSAPNPEDTVITNSLNAKTAGGTFFTETAEINGDGFEAANLTFENTAGNTGQAVAAAVRADRAVFKHVRFLGHQDTLFADFGRQYYLDCFITGGVDYIFGNAAAVFDRSELNSNGPGFITAQSRTSPTQPTGYVILNSRVTSSFDAAARPWTPPPPAPNPPPPPTAPSASAGPGAPTPAPSTSTPSSPLTSTPPAGTTGAKPPTNPPPGTPSTAPPAPAPPPSTRVPWAHTLTAAGTQTVPPRKLPRRQRPLEPRSRCRQPP